MVEVDDDRRVTISVPMVSFAQKRRKRLLAG